MRSAWLDGKIGMWQALEVKIAPYWQINAANVYINGILQENAPYKDVEILGCNLFIHNKRSHPCNQIHIFNFGP